MDYASDESWGPKLDGTPVLHWYNLDPEYPADYLNPEPWLYPENDVNYFFQNRRCQHQQYFAVANNRQSIVPHIIDKQKCKRNSAQLVAES